MSPLAIRCKSVNLQFFNVFKEKNTLECSAHFQWESGQNCRKINQVAVESFQMTPVSQLGSPCICMQLETFGPNERVTLGTSTTITAAGF